MLLSRRLTWFVGPLSFALGACSGSGTPPLGSGGAVGTGGAVGSGGAAVSGGAPGSGGVGTGGTSSGGVGTGGGPGSGGVGTGGTGTGGVVGTGGGSTGGSGAVGPGIADIPPAPGPADVPKPAGTPGDVTVIDWAGFPAAVTYSFDDNDGSQLDHYAEMHAIGGRYTFYLVTGGGLGVAISDARWQAIYDDGNEIGNHTTTHSCSTANIDGANEDILEVFGEKPTTLAAPDGNDACQTQAPGRVFINREVNPANPVTPLGSSNPFALNCYIPSEDQQAGTYNANIDGAISQNGWVIYVIHGIKPTGHNFQPVDWNGLKGAIEYAKENDVWIDTMENIGSYWLGQKAFADATSTVNGTSTTWTWVLPDQFPPDKYLRVTVDGGTLSQGGTPLTWDPHGYYEIALDERSVTLAP